MRERKDDVMRMAREAGLLPDNSHPAPQTRQMVDKEKRIKRFAALIAAAVEDKWKQAVIDELVSCHIYSSRHEDDPRKALHDAICWNVEASLDPKVSSAAEELIQRGAAAEREACAKVCDEMPSLLPTSSNSAASGTRWTSTKDCAAAIRARGQS